jgi:hypothetical protein
MNGRTINELLKNVSWLTLSGEAAKSCSPCTDSPRRYCDSETLHHASNLFDVDPAPRESTAEMLEVFLKHLQSFAILFLDE